MRGEVDRAGDGGERMGTIATRSHRNAGPVGRGTEIARLHETFDRVRRGQAARVLLTGESGIGTSTLADAFCAQLSAGPAVADR